MNKLIQTTAGLELIAMTPAEVIAAAQGGNREAIKELIQGKGGWPALTAAQKDTVIQLAIGIPATL